MAGEKKVRLDGVLWGVNDKFCVFEIIGVSAIDKKRFLTIEDGMHNSIQSWREFFNFSVQQLYSIRISNLYDSAVVRFRTARNVQRVASRV